MDEKEKDTLQQNETSENQNETAENSAELEVIADIAEVESDEHDVVDEYAKEEYEMPDFAQMSKSQLLEEAQRLIAINDVQAMKDEMEELQKAAQSLFNEERAEKLQAFIEEGGVEMDFEYEQPIKYKINDIYKQYKALRHDFYKKLELELSANLEVKLAIIEGIKELPNLPGSVPEKYKTFREYQERWKNTGPVPRTDSNELWNNYHHHLDNFYDFLRISNELRELDFKKNLELKTQLCEEAEALSEKESNAETFKVLQNLHSKWKLVGPVDREQREPMWERFSEATKKIHDKRHSFYEGLREERQQLIEKKNELLEKFKSLDLEKIKSHSAWQNTIKIANEIRDEFKKIGRINLPENDQIWEGFREATRTFNQHKNAFYKNLKSQHQENLQRKKDLLAKAEGLKDSEDWKDASNQLKRIQSDWKKIGYVPKNESDKIWKEFRETCNYFFNRLAEHNKELDKAFDANLETKKAILEELKNWQAANEKSADLKTLKSFITRWKDAGRIPRSAREIDNEFNQLLDQNFTQLKINKKEATMMRFENKVQNLVSGDNSHLLYKEQEQLQRKIDESVKDLQQLENNILFFANADANSPIVKEAHKKIDRQKEEVELLKAKLKMLKKMSAE